MPDFRSKSLPVPASVAAGAAVDVNPRSHLALSLSGSFDATVQFEYSPSSTEDDWFPVGEALSAPGLRYLEPGKASRIRANTTVHTTGDPKAYSFSDAALANSQREREFKEAAMDALASDGEGLAFDLEDGEEALVILSGTFDATLRLQVSLADSDDGDWHDWDTARLSGGLVSIPQGMARRVRLQTSSYVSGAPAARVLYGFTAENNESALKQNTKGKEASQARFVFTNKPDLPSDGVQVFNELDNPTAFEDCVLAAHEEEKKSGQQVMVVLLPVGSGEGNKLTAPAPTKVTHYPTFRKIFHAVEHFGYLEFAEGCKLDGMPELSSYTNCNWQFASSATVLDTDDAGTVANPKKAHLLAKQGIHFIRNTGSVPWLRLGEGFEASFLMEAGLVQFHYASAGHVAFGGPNTNLEILAHAGRFESAHDMLISESPGAGQLVPFAFGGGNSFVDDPLIEAGMQPRFSGIIPFGGFQDLLFNGIAVRPIRSGLTLAVAPVTGSATLVADAGSGKSEIQGIDLSAFSGNDRMFITGAGISANNRLVAAGADGTAGGIELASIVLADEGPVSITVTYVGRPNNLTRLDGDVMTSIGLPAPWYEGTKFWYYNDGDAPVSLEAASYGTVHGPVQIPTGMTLEGTLIFGDDNDWDTQLLGEMNKAPDAPASGALDVDTSLSKVAVNTNAYSLADGMFEGQVKRVIANVLTGGTAVLTPANFADGATLTFSAQWESCELEWKAGAWHTLSANGVVIA
jgi:hypothetical protein